MLKIQQIFPKLYKCLLYVVFHKLEHQKQKPDDVKRDLHSKRSKGIFVCENLNKISIIIKTVIWSEKTLMHKAVRPSNSFKYNQAEQIKKGVICVQILLQIHLLEHGKFHFQGLTTLYTPVLVPPSGHMTSK